MASDYLLSMLLVLHNHHGMDSTLSYSYCPWLLPIAYHQSKIFPFELISSGTESMFSLTTPPNLKFTAWAFPGGAMDKNFPDSAEDTGSIPDPG